MDRIKEKTKDLWALDVPKSHRGNQQQKLDILLQSPADVGRSYQKNASNRKKPESEKKNNYTFEGKQRCNMCDMYLRYILDFLYWDIDNYVK